LGLNTVVERKAWKVSTVSMKGTMKDLQDRQQRLKADKATFHSDMFKVVICWKGIISLVFVLFTFSGILQQIVHV
jgi:hypothetical protein